MGITNFDIYMLERVFKLQPIHTVIELGAQQTYVIGERYGQYADWYYRMKGCQYKCIDISAENNAIPMDLSKTVFNVSNDKVLPYTGIRADLVTDFGTSEHIGTNGAFDWQAIYNCWVTKHAMLKAGGIMVNENPATGNWPGHGFNYYTEEFYHHLAEVMGYEIIEIGSHPTMGNTTDGWNIYCVFRKVEDKDFMTIESFKKLQLLQK